MKELWEQRFANEEYMYGKEPNEFLKAELENITPMKALFIGDGEGRNSVYAAKIGWQVEANDWSENAKIKALKWARENNVSINYNIVDFENMKLDPESYDLIVLIYIHVDAPLREKLHSMVISALKKDGRIILEAYDKDQLKYNSGGPKTLDLLYSLEEIYTDFNDLEIIKFSKETVTLSEGKIHQGKSSVIRYVGHKK
ncbi:MAG: SAM-dependent methyltransferase [Ignavibacteriae bacterium HGW-Ignavibacteriae-2]|jgi:2-polyprenyl-3-methyl-5-hydroxy-6-metoxy-1,4-benzoquinol methylase|nr:class I SAM-dependent methyltransferase [Bacteroidota bacterium]PKL88973.1 MAG: SAM-dependent methyltransferase [Ignavibacteriae bacterium HGW-Ignavibacteriae-2]